MTFTGNIYVLYIYIVCLRQWLGDRLKRAQLKRKSVHIILAVKHKSEHKNVMYIIIEVFGNIFSIFTPVHQKHTAQQFMFFLKHVATLFLLWLRILGNSYKELCKHTVSFVLLATTAKQTRCNSDYPGVSALSIWQYTLTM